MMASYSRNLGSSIIKELTEKLALTDCVFEKEQICSLYCNEISGAGKCAIIFT
jgi:hypothetical protein